MFKFEAWPPEAGKVTLDREAVIKSDITFEQAGQVLASTLLSNCDDITLENMSRFNRYIIEDFFGSREAEGHDFNEGFFAQLQSAANEGVLHV